MSRKEMVNVKSEYHWMSSALRKIRPSMYKRIIQAKIVSQIKRFTEKSDSELFSNKYFNFWIIKRNIQTDIVNQIK